MALVPGKEYPALNMILRGQDFVYLGESNKYYYVYDPVKKKNRKLRKFWWVFVVLDFGTG